MTMALLLCVLSGALPAEAVLDAGDSMPCCRGMKGMGAECQGDSCPMHLTARAKPATRVEHDPVCGAERALQALTGKTSLSAQASSEHEHGFDVSQRDGRQEFAGAASLAKPCPSECCGSAAASFTGLRRPRQEAAQTDNFRPRPPDSEPQSYAPTGLIKGSSALRREHPPRAPPNALDRRTA